MKILCFIDSLCSGGAQRQLIEIGRGLKEKGYEVEFLVYHDIPFYYDILEKAGFKIFLIKENKYIKRILKINKLIKENNYTTIIAFLEGASFIAECVKILNPKIRVIVGERSAKPSIFKSKKLKFYRYFHFFADYITFNSLVNKEMVLKINPYLNNEKLKVIYNSIDPNKWNLNEDYYSCKDNVFKMLVPSSHQYLKNLKGLIEGVNLLSTKDKKRLKIDWYGDDSNDGSKQEALELIKQYHLSTIFRFFPAVHNINEIMSDYDCVGLFSIYEGLPNAICEAMMKGKPVLVTKVSDLPTFLSKEQLIPSYDPISFKNSIEMYLNFENSDLKVLGMCNYDFAIKNFNKRFIIEEYEKLIK